MIHVLRSAGKESGGGGGGGGWRGLHLIGKLAIGQSVYQPI